MKMRTSVMSEDQKTLLKNWEKHRGSIVMVIGDKIFSTKSARRVGKMVQTIEEKFKRRPLITYIPKEGTLSLPGLQGNYNSRSRRVKQGILGEAPYACSHRVI